MKRFGKNKKARVQYLFDGNLFQLIFNRNDISENESY